jgi:hypothetical protein
MNYLEIWSCAVRLIKRWRFPVQSCHDQSEDVFLYRCPVHLYTSPYKTCVCVFVLVFVSLSQIQTQKHMSIQNLVPLFAQKPVLWSKFQPSLEERHCYQQHPFKSIIMIYYQQPLPSFSIDWHVYKMRMNQKVNQMTNSLFTLIHQRQRTRSNIFLLQKTDGIDEVERTAPRCLCIC